MRAQTLCAIILALANIGVGHKVWLDADVRAFEREISAMRIQRIADNRAHEEFMGRSNQTFVANMRPDA